MTIAQNKLDKIRVIKRLAFEAINIKTLDWKILRHQDEKALGLATSLTDSEALDLRAQRQTIRNKSNSLEADISRLETTKAIDSLVISYADV